MRYENLVLGEERALYGVRNADVVGCSFTEWLAEWIQQKAGGDLFVIKTVTPYSADHDASIGQGRKDNR